MDEVHRSSCPVIVYLFCGKLFFWMATFFVFWGFMTPTRELLENDSSKLFVRQSDFISCDYVKVHQSFKTNTNGIHSLAPVEVSQY